MVSELERLLGLARNNRVFDLKSSDATILLVCPKDTAGEKNTFAFEKNTLAARGGKRCFRGGEQTIFGKLRERGESFKRISMVFPRAS